MKLFRLGAATLLLSAATHAESLRVSARECALFLSADSLPGVRVNEWRGQAPVVKCDTAGETTALRAERAALLKVSLGNTVTALDLRLSESSGDAELKNLPLRSLALRSRHSRFDLLGQPSTTELETLLVSLRGGKSVIRGFSPRTLEATVTGGRLTLDLSAARAGIRGKITAAAGRVTVILPDMASVRVTNTPSAMTLLSGQGFESAEGAYLKKGPGPEFVLTLTGALSRISFVTAAESGDEEPETKPPPWMTVTALEAPGPFTLRYNRVEGLFWNVGIDTRRKTHAGHGLLLDLGYAISPHIVQFGLGAAVQLLERPYPMNLYLLHSQKIESEDNAVMSEGENSLHALLFGRDYRDYYLAKSNLIKGDWTLWRSLTLDGILGISYYHALTALNPFHFLGDTLFRPNPWVREGEDHFIRAGMTVKRHGDTFPRRGWFLKSNAEYSGGAIQSQFTYRKLTGEARGYAAPSPETEVAGRFFLGEVTGKNGPSGFATQKLFDLGGPGTVRGLPFRTDASLLDQDRMTTLSVEIKRRGDFFRRLIAIGFIDAGEAWNTEDFKGSNVTFTNPWNDFEFGRLYKTFGVGFALPDESLRLDVMRCRTPGDTPFFYDSILLRFHRAF